MNMKTPSILITATVATLCLHFPALADETTRTTAYQSSVSQEQLRLASQRLKQEMIALAGEYSGYQAAAPEVAKLEAAIGSLAQLSEEDMPAVVQALAAASRNDNPTAVRGDLVKVNTHQKDIQSTLRSLADKLAHQADEATLQKRLEDLAVRQSENLRATRKLAAIAAAPNTPSEGARLEAIEDLAIRKAEQKTLEKEIGLAVATLRKIAKTADPATGNHLAEALATAETGKLEQKAKAASTALESASPDSATHQQQILEQLKAMATTMAGSRTAEEQTRELADAISELSQKQQGLANKTPKLDGRNQKQAGKGQQDVATRLDLLKERIARVSEKAAPETDAAFTRSQTIADQIADKEFVSDARNLALTADAQKDLAAKLASVAETLQQQADALAAANSPPPALEPEMSAEEKAIQEAMAQLLDAKANNALARRQNNQKQDFQERLAMARKELAEAEKKASEAGSEVAQNVDQYLKDADSHAAIAATGKEPEHNLYHTNANVDKALAALQEAANQLATADKDQMPGTGEGKGKGSGGIGVGKGPPAGKRFAAGSAAGEAQRDALSLLNQEKAAPDYEPMINQYIKNLANDR